MAGGAPVASACELSQIAKCSDVGASEPREQLEFRDSKATADKAVVLWRSRCGLSRLAHRTGILLSVETETQSQYDVDACGPRVLRTHNAEHCGGGHPRLAASPVEVWLPFIRETRSGQPQVVFSLQPNECFGLSSLLREWRVAQSVGGANGEREIAA